MNLDDVKLTMEYVGEVAAKRKSSKEVIADYYRQLGDKYGNNTFYDIAKNLENCNKFWFFDSYEAHKIRDLKAVSKCHNKFCLNCQKEIQATRLYRFTPVLDSFTADYDLYHCVLTVPNVSANELNETINIMFKSFYYLTRYFLGKAKIKGINFSQYGCVGALRSLEITYKHDYHPHLHVIFIMSKGLNFEKEYINDYSFSYGVLQRRFSEFEIYLQKIWFLLINNIKVNIKNLNDVDLGYSVILDKVDENSYYEVFKYCTKTYTDDDEIMTFNQFETLYNALYNRRTIQGYGVLFNISVNDEIDESNKKMYDDFINYLQSMEKPKQVCYQIGRLIQELGREDNSYIYITRRNIYDFLRKSDNEVFEYKSPYENKYIEFEDGVKISQAELMRQEVEFEEQEKENIRAFFERYNREYLSVRDKAEWEIWKMLRPVSSIQKLKRNYFKNKQSVFKDYVNEKDDKDIKKQIAKWVREGGTYLDEDEIRYIYKIIMGLPLERDKWIEYIKACCRSDFETYDNFYQFYRSSDKKTRIRLEFLFGDLIKDYDLEKQVYYRFSF